MKKALPMAIILAVAYAIMQRNKPVPESTQNASNIQPHSKTEEAFKQRLSDQQVPGEGVAIKILPDDNKGSRPQRFVLQPASGQTLLVAHNSDLAPRIDALAEGDKIAFAGEYEWNEKAEFFTGPIEIQMAPMILDSAVERG